MKDDLLISKQVLNSGIVVQHNDLIESCHRMTLIEMRIMSSFISSLRRNDKNDISRIYVISVSDYNSIYKTSNNYVDIRSAVDRLFKRSVLLLNQPNRRLRINFVESAEYIDGHIKIKFTSSIIELLEGLKGNFTALPLNIISKLKTTYGIRILELLKQYEMIGERKIDIGEIRTMFELEDKYSKYADFRKRVIDTAVSDINANTDYDVSYVQNKVGRKITSVTFKFNGKEVSAARKVLKFIGIFNKEKEKGNKLFIGRHAILAIEKKEYEQAWIARTRIDASISLTELLVKNKWLYIIGAGGIEREFKVK